MSSQDHYRSQRSTQLPSIRDLLPDQFEDSAYSFDAMGRALPQSDPAARSGRNTWPQTGPTLAPIAGQQQHHAHTTGYNTPSSRGGSTGHHAHAQSYHYAQQQQHQQAPGAPPYSFDVFRPSSDGLLVHAATSSRSQGILRSTRADAGRRHTGDEEEDADDSSKRYVCSACGKRFARPSSLRTHEVVHSEEKAHVCPYLGCGKSFSVASNMRRHYRKTHENYTGPDYD